MSNRSDPVEGDGQRSERIHGILNDCLLRRSAGEVIRDESIIAAHPELVPEWLVDGQPTSRDAAELCATPDR